MIKTQPVGIFDSGIGGLTVARSLEHELPNEQFIYFGDTAHMPYGDKTPEEILHYSRKIVDFLISKNVKLIVIACNSASSIAASQLRADYWKYVEIMGVIRPVIKSIIRKNIKRIGIIGTQATIKSNIYPSIIKESGENIDIYQKATPLLAPIIEQGHTRDAKLDEILSEYLSDENFKDKEAILLACTHYPLIANEIKTFFNYGKEILDNATPLACEVKRYLTEKNLLSGTKQSPNEFYVSRYSPNFEKTIETFYGKKIEVKEVKLSD